MERDGMPTHTLPLIFQTILTMETTPSPFTRKPKRTYAHGFSFVEIMVVLLILSTMALVIIPKLSPSLGSNGVAADRDRLISLIESMKHESVKGNTNILLHMDPILSKAWITRGGTALSQVHWFPHMKRIVGIPDNMESSHAVICFYAAGYSQGGLMHIGEGTGAQTLKIHPFLPRVEILHGHVFPNDCI